MATVLPLAWKDMEAWGNRFNPRFNRILRLRFVKAFEELNIKKVKINSEYAIYPASYYESVAKMKVIKTIDFCFIGGIRANKLQKRSREWIHPFINKHFGEKSYLKFTDETAGYISKGSYDNTNKSASLIPRKMKDNNQAVGFDQLYFLTLKSSKFCLCPAGDAPWSMRFYEALMCKSIPIVHYKWESWKTEGESKLDYKYYLTTDKEFIYRADWAEHNYKIFMEFHTLNKTNLVKYVPEAINKCVSINCSFIKHAKFSNNGGLYCCVCCKKNNGKKHGLVCTGKIWNIEDISTIDSLAITTDRNVALGKETIPAINLTSTQTSISETNV
jgi:hypothetical protein